MLLMPAPSAPEKSKAILCRTSPTLKKRCVASRLKYEHHFKLKTVSVEV
jgi:hypothetical protein